MREPVVMWHRAGLGDHLVAAGLVNYLSGIYSRVYVVCSNPANLETLKFLYRQLPTVEVIDFDTPSERQVYQLAADKGARILTAMFDYVYHTWSTCWVACYEEYSLPYSTRYSFWPAPGDGPRSDELYDQLVDPTRPYRVVHNSYSGGVLETVLPDVGPEWQTILITPEVTSNLFDWCRILTNANQIHVVDSSVLHLLFSLGSQIQGEVYFHHIRPHSDINLDLDILSRDPQWKLIRYD